MSTTSSNSAPASSLNSGPKGTMDPPVCTSRADAELEFLSMMNPGFLPYVLPFGMCIESGNILVTFEAT